MKLVIPLPVLGGIENLKDSRGQISRLDSFPTRRTAQSPTSKVWSMLVSIIMLKSKDFMLKLFFVVLACIYLEKLG